MSKCPIPMTMRQEVTGHYYEISGCVPIDIDCYPLVAAATPVSAQYLRHMFDPIAISIVWRRTIV
ncbi:MAG: hypothetical protein KAJ25_05510, partial [Desulfobacula sp.]|nr:hypothetical protein [Desulfobacula sp.]